MSKTTRLLSLILWVGVSCTGPTADERYIEELKGRLAALESEKKELTEKMAKTSDAGTLLGLRHDLSLLDSRIKRLQGQIDGTVFK